MSENAANAPLIDVKGRGIGSVLEGDKFNSGKGGRS